MENGKWILKIRKWILEIKNKKMDMASYFNN